MLGLAAIFPSGGLLGSGPGPDRFWKSGAKEEVLLFITQWIKFRIESYPLEDLLRWFHRREL